LFKLNTHSFILRIWLERREIKNAFPHWRGTIEHVATGEQRSFNRIDEIPRLIKPFLKSPGSDAVPRKSIGRWLKQLIFFWKKP
jgi:hypothetical protein